MLQMATSSVIARRYFDALGRHDVQGALACWQAGALHRLAGRSERAAPDQLRELLDLLFAAFPDFALEVLDVTTHRQRCAVRWRARGTFVGPGRLQGFAPNNGAMSIEGCDVLQVESDLIVAGDVYADPDAMLRQLGLMPDLGSSAQGRRTALINAGTGFGRLWHGARAEAIAAGVWVLRGWRPRLMNVYLIEDGDGVTVFDAGVATMAGAIRGAAVRLGGIRRVVLSHADCDHRGAATALGAPLYCHPLERSAAESPSPFRDYWNLELLSSWGAPLYPVLMRSWDGGALELAGTLDEGDEIAGFRVVHLPGHAPGLIGLFREEDRLALVSDCVHTINARTGLRAWAHVPHPALNQDTERARESIRKLAALRPAVAWPGHALPVAGDDVDLQMQRAASAAL